MKYNKSKNPLWHGVRVENAAKILDSGKLEARTTQRYWPDGLRRKDNHPEYRSSYIMKGWSMTRDFMFAASWSDVVFELDKTKIQERLKIQPFSWNSSIDSIRDHKKEREEFVIARFTGKSFDDYRDMYQKIREDAFDKYEKTGDRKHIDKFPYKDFLDLIKAPEAKTIPLKFCKSIYLDSKVESIYGSDNKDIITVKSHSLYKGLYDSEKLIDIKNDRQEIVERLINISNKRKRIKI